MPSDDEKPEWVRLDPPLAPASKARRLYAEHVARLVDELENDAEDLAEAVRSIRRRGLEMVDVCKVQDQPALRAAVHVSCDLAQQRWKLRVSRRTVEAAPPEHVSDPATARAEVRRQELIKRDEQLARPAVQRFVRGMEVSRLHRGAFVSIFSLMRDGRELAASLERARSTSDLAARATSLAGVVDPYLQFVQDDEARCEFTGLRLLDVWRYFRHTWTNQYTSVPGRSMVVLIRDRAVERHPVVGIAAINSPIVQIRERDAWIGWHPAVFLERFTRERSVPTAQWLIRVVNAAIEEIYVDDLLEEDVLTLNGLRNPDEGVLQALSDLGDKERRAHHRYVQEAEHKRSTSNGVDRWRRRAETPLFRSKRAVTLAGLLRCRLVFARHLRPRPSKARIGEMLETAAGKKAVLKALRRAKGDSVGIAMADISVCGAIPPYNPILGGKLAAMLCASPEVVEAYAARYARAESEIASAMAGQAIVRTPELVLLGTTSLYGVASSQYNRVRIPADRLGGDPREQIRFQKLGRSESFGTSQYSGDTIEALVHLTRQANGGQRVNSIFGEGTSPKMRKVREGLDVLGFPSEVLLRHFRQRIVYGVSLVRNLREYLLGMDEKPDYLFTVRGADATAAITQWWRERWLAKRIEREDVLGAVALHTLVHPIRHGARVQLPAEHPTTTPLFDDL